MNARRPPWDQWGHFPMEERFKCMSHVWAWRWWNKDKPDAAPLPAEDHARQRVAMERYWSIGLLQSAKRKATWRTR